MIVTYTMTLPGPMCPRPDMYLFSSRPLAADTPRDADRVDAYLEQALRLPTAIRQAFLDRLGEEQPELRRILDDLLAGLDEAPPPGFLPPLPPARPVMERLKKELGDGPKEA